MNFNFKPIVILTFIGLILLFGNGCQLAPVIVLWNGGTSELKIENPDRKLTLVKPKTKHKLSLSKSEVSFSAKDYSLVLIQNGKRLGYRVDFQSLRQLQTLRFHRIDFQIDDESKIYVLRVDNLNFNIASNQPAGFPAIPTTLDELH